MFDIPCNAHPRAPIALGECIRLAGAELMRKVGKHMIRAAREIDGDEGAALAYACRDMIFDVEVTPEHWPLADLIALLRRADVSQELRMTQVLDALQSLIDAIDANAN
jgi:hypothetical protein